MIKYDINNIFGFIISFLLKELQKFDYDTFYDENSKPNKNQVLR